MGPICGSQTQPCFGVKRRIGLGAPAETPSRPVATAHRHRKPSLLCRRPVLQQRLCLQLVLEFVEEPPVGVLVDDLLWAVLDHSHVAHPQRVKTH